ncbi:unnamed protein product [Psylliodes chrysocephalus]|uniref:Transmembrane protein n=1 Tax=Psylliodes chrysocephalus TaxID=3402493 RepID=A0A9P0CNR6_9CUCU|nr:unnamed protein product [Psylliodes chrysocephala]
MKGPVFALVFAIVIASCWADDTNKCTHCATSLSAVTSIITSVQEALASILHVLPLGLGLIINALLSLLVVIINILGKAVAGGAGSLLGGIGHLLSAILGAIASCWADDTNKCTHCATSLSAVTNIITSVQEALAPILHVLPLGLGLIVNALLSLLVVIINILVKVEIGKATFLLGGIGHLLSAILGGIGK